MNKAQNNLTLEQELDRRERWLTDLNLRMEEIIKSLAPPTEKELCKALSQQLKKQVKTGKNKHGITFNYAETGKKIISLNYNLLHMNVQLPLHLTKMVVLFYVGERK